MSGSNSLRVVVVTASARSLPSGTQAPSQLVQPLRQLNRCPPRVRNIRTCYSRRQYLVRRIQLDPARLQLLAERLEVLNLETNVIERAAFGRLRHGVSR